jgi:hypothetical protein
MIAVPTPTLKIHTFVKDNYAALRGLRQARKSWREITAMIAAQLPTSSELNYKQVRSAYAWQSWHLRQTETE